MIVAPNLLPAHMILGQALLETDSPDDAAVEFRRAIELTAPGSPERRQIENVLKMGIPPH